VKYRVELSDRAARDLDRLGRDVQERMMKRLEQLAQDPYSTRLSGPLTNQGGLRKSRVGGWRIVLRVGWGTSGHV
jgi:mRNA-degrading endonuclease RelE of RelBE toxin-antitoxin system